MKKVEFSNRKLAVDGSDFAFYYEGMCSEKIDIVTIEEKLDKFVNTTDHSNMIRNVSFLRTILREFDEDILFISYKNKEISETVAYNFGDLFRFRQSQKECVVNEFKERKIEYQSHSGIKFDFCDTESDTINYSYLNNISEKVSEVVNYIYKLKHAERVELDKDSKSLIEIYKLFYNENPNFNDENINVRIQTMMSILAGFGVSLDDYSFRTCEKEDMSVSLQLEEEVEPSIKLVKKIKTKLED